MKKWYNIELTQEEWTDFRAVLKKDGEEIGEPWIYEAAAVGDMIYIKIQCAPSELCYLNKLLQEIF